MQNQEVEREMRHSEKLALLREVLTRRQPDLLPLVEKIGVDVLTEEQLDSLREAVLDEFTDVGLQEDSEPNPRGLGLDELAGFLVGHQCNPNVSS